MMGVSQVAEATPSQADSGRAYRLVLMSLQRRWPGATIGTLTMLLASGVALLPPLVMKRIVDDAISAGDLSLLGKLSLLLAGLYVAATLLDLIASTVFTVIGQSMLHEIRRLVFGRVLRLPIEFLEQKQTGYLTARLGEISSVGMLFSPNTFRILVSVVQFMGVLAIMLTMNARLTAVLLALLPVYYIAVRALSSGLKRTSKRLMETGETMSAKLQETFDGVAEVKSLGAEEHRAQEAIRVSDEYVKAGARQSAVALFGSQAVMLLTSLISVALLYLVGRDIVLGAFTLGGYLAFSGYISKLLAPFSNVMSYSLMVQPALAALERVHEFVDEVTEEERFSEHPSPGTVGGIEFRNVGFAYPSEPDRAILDGISFKASRPSSLAIVGPNGAGKSTIVKLLLGYYPGYSGEILVNGRELRETNVLDLRRRIATVSQSPFLFDGTVAENLELAVSAASEGIAAKPGSSHEPNAGTQHVDLEQSLARLKEKHPFTAKLLERLPQGLNTRVGEGGKQLSGGQRQIVAILRALLRDADVIVFDEATAHLDDEVRQLVREGVELLFADKICVVLTHDPDLATLMESQMHLESGRVRRFVSR